MDQATRDLVRDGAKRSAEAVLPIVFAQLGVPTALLEVGAGEGWWGCEAERLGVSNVYMLDRQPWVGIWNDSRGAHSFEVHPWNAELHNPLPYVTGKGKRWPLAVCLETAEHVSAPAGDRLVEQLCAVAERVLWSAAIPGQGGDGHINEQWPDYWSVSFYNQGYKLTDPFRDALWMDPRVEPWYRQNILLAVPQGDDPWQPPRALVDPVTWAFHRGVEAP